jgi:hypothetical protein
MSKTKDNSQVVLDDILKVFHHERAPSLSESEFFELFCAEQLLKNYELSYDELQDGIVDGEHDGGIDSFYAFANGELITDDFDPSSYKKEVHIEVFIIQSKTGSNFEEASIDRLISVTRKLMDLTIDPDSRTEINEQVRTKFKEFRNAYRALAARFPKVSINYFLAAKRPDVSIPVNFKKKMEELEATAKSFFDNSKVMATAVGAAALRDMAGRQPQTTFELRCKKSVTADKGVIALSSLADYNTFLRDETGAVRKGVFDLNVRDSQGNTEVNAEIRETLREEGSPEFWWLNNGVTILAERATVSGDVVTISGPQVVNGLQTSTQIYEQFDSGEVKDEDQSILVKIISSDDEATRDRIIKATNSQNAIQPATLRATDKIQRDIEASLKASGLFYDRRKNYYKNQGKQAEKIISIPLMAQSLMAVLLGRPDDARARPSSLIKNDSNYVKVFDDKIPMRAYVLAGTLIKAVESRLRERPGLEAKDRNNLRFYVLAYLVWELTGDTEPSAAKLSTIELDDGLNAKIDDVIDVVSSKFIQLGGTDQVAKGADFKAELKKTYNTRAIIASISI